MKTELRLFACSMGLGLLLCVTPALAGSFADYLRAIKPLPARMPTPQLADPVPDALCEEGAEAEAAKEATRVALRQVVRAETEAYESGLAPGSTGTFFAPEETPETSCAARVRGALNALRLEQQQLARDYSALRVKTLLGRQRCRPASGGEDAEELQAACAKLVNEKLAVPFAESAQKLWPSYWIGVQARVERVRRELADCVEMREQAEAEAFKAGALRQGNAEMAAFMRATREPVIEFADLRKAACRAVEAPVRASQWSNPAWVSYGPATTTGGDGVPELFVLKNLP